MIVPEKTAVVGSLGDGLDEPAIAAARAACEAGESRLITLPASSTEPIEIFVDVLRPSPTLVLVGGVHIAIALAAIAKTLGYRTLVIDPRRAFGTEARFPHVDRLIRAWPDDAFQQIVLTRSTAVAMLTHDPKIDDPALKIVLASHAFYVGALGSRTTQAKRLARLRKAGLSDEQLARLCGPIGLNIGAHQRKSPGRDGRPLRVTDICRHPAIVTNAAMESTQRFRLMTNQPIVPASENDDDSVVGLVYSLSFSPPLQSAPSSDSLSGA
jgi:xanthine dehydrogenase accessory factor